MRTRLALLWLLLHLLDIATTIFLSISSGAGREGAPLVAAALEAGPAAYALVSLAGLAAYPALLLLAERLQAPRGLAGLLLALLLALKAYTVANNTLLALGRPGLPPPPLLFS